MITSAAYQKYIRLSLPLFFPIFISGCASEKCPTISGLDALLHSKKVLLLGEIHGTQEAPEFLYKIICNALNKNLTVTLGLELPPTDQKGVELFLQSKGKKADRDQLLNLSFWEY